METLKYKTKSANKASVQRDWYVIDASGQITGRLASKIASILRGKNKPYYTPHVDCGDYVIVVNAEKIRFTGKKWTDKKYISYTGYPGGQKVTTPKELAARHPERILEKAIKGMLPKNPLGRAMFRKLFVYTGPDHPHAAQKPKPLNI